MKINKIYLLLFIINYVVGTSLFAASYTKEQEKALSEKKKRLSQAQSEYESVREEETEQRYVLSYFVPYIDAAIRIKELVDEDIKEIEKSLGTLDKIPDIGEINTMSPDRISNFYIEAVQKLNTLELSCYSVRSITVNTLPRLSRLQDIHGKYIKEQQLIDKHMPSVRGVIGKFTDYVKIHKDFVLEQSKKCKDLEETIQTAREKMFTFWIQSIAQKNANVVLEFENMLKVNDMIKLIWDIYMNAFMDIFDFIRRKNFYRAERELRKVKLLKETLRKIVVPYLISQSVLSALDAIDKDFEKSFEDKRQEIGAIPRKDWLPQRFERLKKEYEYVKTKYGENHKSVQRMKKEIDTALQGNASYMKEAHIYSLLDYAEQDYINLYEKAN